ncbi:uncharacterized protein PADG_07266 [Paracoccidioides brasiliensis Pb18]|uniref:Uncharacterized protein n=1 Tax=Paracoccidioides brasiliensis (strain Pb18) TaxID=502780 RepID=C1GJ30_PARBD|nr:uncharacterized protein PADG_07266 [Paracoccidioides brasiliensis Pb18]EEH42446.2 hypothetical protein PADG_07266 [Paracoccidioides brasiliensis Pb18]
MPFAASMSSVQVELKTRRCYHFIRMARGYSFSRLLNCFFVRWDTVAVFPEITEDVGELDDQKNTEENDQVVATPSPALRISDTSSGDGTKSSRFEPESPLERHQTLQGHLRPRASRQLPEKFLTRSLKDLEDVQQVNPIYGYCSQKSPDPKNPEVILVAELAPFDQQCVSSQEPFYAFNRLEFHGFGGAGSALMIGMLLERTCQLYSSIVDIQKCKRPMYPTPWNTLPKFAIPNPICQGKDDNKRQGVKRTQFPLITDYDTRVEAVAE